MFRAGHIAVEGPRGVGKTALAALLAERHSARLVSAPRNPFAESEKQPFQTQLFNLLSGYQAKEELEQEDLFARGVVADHLFGCQEIYAELELSRDELALYRKVHALLDAQLPRPDLIVYLQARPDVLMSRLKKRRPDGKMVSKSYLEKLGSAYSDYFFRHSDSPVLVVNTSEIDFVDDRKQAEELLAVIGQKRQGVSHYNPLGSR